MRRGGDTSVRLGEQAHTELLLTNTGRRDLVSTVRDAWTPSAGARGGVQQVRIPARQRRRLELTLQPTRRGDRRAGPVVVRALGPLRVAGRQAQHDAPWTVRALPPFSARKHLPSRLARLRELDGRATILQRGQGTEFDSLREYVPGDDVRSIDWRGTARSSTVVVRTWRPERDRHVLIVIDSGRTSAGRVGDQPKLDHAMDAALLLAALASRAGDRVDLLVADRDVRASVLRASAAEILPAFVNAMATIEPVLAETDHRELVTEIATRVTQRSLIVILTGLDAAAITEGLIPVLGTAAPQAQDRARRRLRPPGGRAGGRPGRRRRGVRRGRGRVGPDAPGRHRAYAAQPRPDRGPGAPGDLRPRARRPLPLAEESRPALSWSIPIAEAVRFPR